MAIPRAIRKVFQAVQTSEGVGAKVRRSIGTPQQRYLTPFLMLDHFTVDPGAGFADHPHRGIETLTLMLSGIIDHEDFAGNAGSISTGDLQFMTAGRGIMHAEMPRPQSDGSPNVGLQLWVDLPKHLKDCEPRYRDLKAKEIPIAKTDDGKAVIKVISGQSYGVDSVRDLSYTPVWFLDVEIQAGGKIEQSLPVGWNAFIYTINGTAKFGSEKTSVAQFHNIIWEQQGDYVTAEVDTDANEGARFAIIAGQPLDQEVYQYGPFVLAEQDGIRKAMVDFRTHSNGFERGEGWESKIAAGFH